MSLANSTTYTDSTGENAALPDITTVVVSNDDAGFITFRVNTPNRPTMSGVQTIQIILDVDRNVSTGSSGFDHILQAVGGAFALYRWTGSTFDRTNVPQATLSFAYSSGATFRINASELGNTRSFGFYVFAGDTSSGPGDFAPDGTAIYGYEVNIQVTPPPPPSNRVAITSFTRNPLIPIAGQNFSVSVTVRRVGRPGVFTNGVVYCEAKVSGRTLRFFGSPTRGSAACLWPVPANAAGKRLTGRIGVSEGGGPAVFRSFSYSVIARGAVLKVVGIQTSPATGPAAGSRFQFAAGIRVEHGGSGDRIQRGTVDCVAAIGSRRLKAIQKEVRKDSGIICGWNIPSYTSGQALTGYALVKSGGGSKRIPFRYTID